MQVRRPLRPWQTSLAGSEQPARPGYDGRSVIIHENSGRGAERLGLDRFSEKRVRAEFGAFLADSIGRPGRRHHYRDAGCGGAAFEPLHNGEPIELDCAGFGRGQAQVEHDEIGAFAQRADDSIGAVIGADDATARAFQHPSMQVPGDLIVFDDQNFFHKHACVGTQGSGGRGCLGLPSTGPRNSHAVSDLANRVPISSMPQATQPANRWRSWRGGVPGVPAVSKLANGPGPG